MEGVNRTGVLEGGSGSDDNTAADDNDAQVLRVYSMIGICSEYRLFFVLQVRVLRVLRQYWRPEYSEHWE